MELDHWTTRFATVSGVTVSVSSNDAAVKRANSSLKPWALYRMGERRRATIILGVGKFLNHVDSVWSFDSGETVISSWVNPYWKNASELHDAVSFVEVPSDALFIQLRAARERYVAAHQVRWSPRTHARFPAGERGLVKWFLWAAMTAFFLPREIAVECIRPTTNDEDAERASRIILERISE